MKKFEYTTAQTFQRLPSYPAWYVYSYNLYTLILPWGKFKYKKILICLVASVPDILQEVMNCHLGNLEYVIYHTHYIVIL